MSIADTQDRGYATPSNNSRIEHVAAREISVGVPQGLPLKTAKSGQ
jgi:hypothetical protein